MTTINISGRAKTLNTLLRRAKSKSLILKSSDGHRFVLSSVEGWDEFEVGEDITQNKRLMKHLAERRKGRKAIPLESVKAELGL